MLPSPSFALNLVLASLKLGRRIQARFSLQQELLSTAAPMARRLAAPAAALLLLLCCSGESGEHVRKMQAVAASGAPRARGRGTPAGSVLLAATSVTRPEDL